MARFTVQATRGLIREQRARRRLMAILLGVAVLMIVLGLTLLAPWIEPRGHRGWFIFFWFVCAWLTLTAFLLAIADLLMLRVEARRTRNALRDEAADDRKSALDEN